MNTQQKAQQQEKQRRWLATGWLLALGSAALFALRPVLVKLVYAEGVDSTTLIAWRMLFSAPIYLAMLGLLLSLRSNRQRLDARTIGACALVGVLGYFGASYFDLLGLHHVSAQLGRLILYTYPGFVVLLGAALFGRRVTGSTLLALLLTYAGVAVIFGHDLQQFGSSVPRGAVLISMASLCFAFYLLYSRPLVARLGSRLFTCIALLCACAAILLFAWLSGSFDAAPPSRRALWLIGVIALFCTVIPSFMTAEAIARIGSEHTSIAAMTGPVVTSAAAVTVLGEAFTGWHVLGIALVIAGVSRLR